MVRTRADAVTARVSGAKAPRKISTAASSILHPSDKNKGREHSAGNSYCPRETPEWQKPITSFFIRPPPESGESSKRGEQMDLKDSHLVAGTSTSGGSTSKEDETD